MQRGEAALRRADGDCGAGRRADGGCGAGRRSDGGCVAGRRVRRLAGGQQRRLEGAWAEAADAWDGGRTCEHADERTRAGGLGPRVGMADTRTDAQMAGGRARGSAGERTCGWACGRAGWLKQRAQANG